MSTDALTDEIDLSDIDLNISAEESPTTITAAAAGTFSQPAFPPANLLTRGELYFDLETIPDESRRHLAEIDQPAETKPFTNPPIEGEAWVAFMKQTMDDIKQDIAGFNPDETWLEAFHAWERNEKKPRKGVLDLIKNIKASRTPDPKKQAEIEAAKVKALSLNPHLCRIVAMGIGWANQAVGLNGPHDVVSGFVVSDTISEAELLEWFWDSVKTATTLVGFNCLGFDLKVIFARSILLGVLPSRSFDRRPWGTDVLDLMLAADSKGQAIKDGDAKISMGLKAFARYYGIEIPTGDVEGSQVAELYRTDPAKLAEYVKSDVVITQQLRRKWRGYFC